MDEMDEREMYNEISALLGMVAKAFDVSDVEVITALEQGRLGMEMKTDSDGCNYIEATCDGRTAQIHPGAIFRPGDHPDSDHGGGCDG